jgi:predicted DNA binding CopG/RHH family protein
MVEQMSKLITEMTPEEVEAIIARQVLDPEEQEIEDAMKAGHYKRGADFEQRMKGWKAALENSERKLPISMRVSSRIMDRLRMKARVEGMPYQTLINSILHKYVNGRLVERD